MSDMTSIASAEVHLLRPYTSGTADFIFKCCMSSNRLMVHLYCLLYTLLSLSFIISSQVMLCPTILIHDKLCLFR